MRRKFSSVCSTERIPGKCIQLIAKGPLNANIRSQALYSIFLRYIRTILRFRTKEAEVRKQEVHENVLRIF